MAVTTPDPATVEAVEQMIGTFCYAVGSGAQMRIRLEAIAQIREALYASLLALARRPDWEQVWKKDSVHACEIARLTGRLAASTAVNRGAWHIERSDMDDAIRTMMSRLPSFGASCSGLSGRFSTPG